MPTTSLSAWSFANHGPLTTVFTPPASCFSVVSQVQLATMASDTDTNMTSLVPYFGVCNTTLPYWATAGDCLPSGKAIESEYATIDLANPTATLIIDYYSPGLYCPSGYATVGVATNDAGTITSSGDGFVPTTRIEDSIPMFNPVPNILLQGLDRGETAVICCPNSFQVDLYGNCFSLLPSYPTPTTACFATVPEEDLTIITTTVSIFGTAFTNGVLQAISSLPITATETRNIVGAESLSVISVAPMITLIHNAAEAAAYTSSPTSTTSRSGATSRAEINNMKILLLSCWVVVITTGISLPALFYL